MPFVDARTIKMKRVVLSVWGMPKDGKTHFALTGRKPVYYHSLDVGIQELLPKFRKQRIKVADYSMTEETDVEVYGPLLKSFHEDYLLALRTPGPGTIVVDTATQLWQVINKVKLDGIKKNRKDGRILPFDYADANTYMGGMLRRAMQQNEKDVIFIGRAKPIYIKSESTGVFEFQGFNETPSIVQATLQIIKRENEEGQPFWVARIESNRFDPELNGMELESPTLDLVRELFLGEGE
jgi:hypothetical protein